MSNWVVKLFESGKETLRHTASETFDFLSVKVGASALEIKETTGHFDFSAKKLTNIASGGAAGEALSYTQRGAANGVASLDGGGKVPVTQLPNSIMEYQGMWNATTNSPSLADGVGNTGDVYRVSVAGTQDLGSGSISYSVGDYAIYNGTTWEKADTTDSVVSVNGFVGVVSLTADDVPEGATNFYFTSSRFNTAFAAKTTDNLTEGSTNLYFTAARAKTAAVSDSISDGVTDVAPSQNAVFDALALKRNIADQYKSLVNDNAGSITIRQLVYIKSNGAVDLAKANAAGTALGTLGFVFDATIATTVAGNITIQQGTRIGGFSSLTPGAPQFMSAATAGAITETAPAATTNNVIRVVGYAVSASEIVFQPELGTEVKS